MALSVSSHSPDLDHRGRVTANGKNPHCTKPTIELGSVAHVLPNLGPAGGRAGRRAGGRTGERAGRRAGRQVDGQVGGLAGEHTDGRTGRTGRPWSQVSACAQIDNSGSPAAESYAWLTSIPKPPKKPTLYNNQYNRLLKQEEGTSSYSSKHDCIGYCTRWLFCGSLVCGQCMS